jgi:hypothetical protein
MRSFDRHFCPKCDWLFPVAKNVTKCGRCKEGGPGRYDDEGQPVRVAHYFKVKDHIRAAFGAKALAKAAKYAHERPPPDEEMCDRELEDVWDGEIMDELFHNADPRIEKWKTYYANLAFDGIEVKKKVNFEYSHHKRTPSHNQTPSYNRTPSFCHIALFNLPY